MSDIPVKGLSPQRRRVPARHDSPETWLYAREVAKILGVARETVIYLVRNGSLHPIQDVRQAHLFDPDEVDAWAKSHPRLGSKYYSEGDLTAEAFKLFAAGKSRREVVITLRASCEKVDQLYEEYQRGDFDQAIRHRRATRLQRQLDKEQRERQRATAARQERQERLLNTMLAFRGAPEKSGK